MSIVTKITEQVEKTVTVTEDVDMFVLKLNREQAEAIVALTGYVGGTSPTTQIYFGLTHLGVKDDVYEVIDGVTKELIPVINLVKEV